MKSRTYFFLNLFLCALFSACNVVDSGPLNLTAGNWGHLQDLLETHPSKLFLSHVKKGEGYKICLAQYMADKYPGIEAELKAGVNIWAYYVGRSIDVNINVVDLPLPEFEDSEENLLEEYQGLCPADTHLVVGESYFSGTAVGKTFYTYQSRLKGGRDQIRSFKRGLFLKKPLEIGEEVNEEDGEDIVVWKSLAQVTGKALSADDILELMKKREEKVYLTGNYELLTFKTILHELGHIWGLCDQYALNGHSTNCDGGFASINEEGHITLQNDAIMSRSSWIGKIYLTDDDIEGIRQLAQRPEFNHNWPMADSFRQIKVPPIRTPKTIELAQINSVELDSMKISIDLGLVTTEAFSVEVNIFDKNSSSWVKFRRVLFNSPVTTRHHILEVPVGRYDPVKVQVIVRDQHSKEKVTLEASVETNPPIALGN